MANPSSYRIPMQPPADPASWQWFAQEDPDEALMRQFAPPAPPASRGTSPMIANLPPWSWRTQEDPDEALMRQFAPPAPPASRGTSPMIANLPPPPPPPHELSLDGADNLPPPPNAGPGVRMGSGVINPGYIDATAPDPYYQKYKDLADRQAAHLRTRPTASDKQYARPGWQQAMMVGANALAGLVNASGRTHVQPIDAETVSRRPKFEAAMDHWDTEGSGMNAELAAINHEREQKMKEQDELRRKDLTQSTIELNKAHADDYREDKRRPGQDLWSTPGGLYSKSAKGIIPGTSHPPANEKETPAQAHERVKLEAEDLIKQGLLKRGSPEHVYMLTNQGKTPAPHAPPRARAGRDPNQASPSQLIAIENRKAVAIRKAKSTAQSEIDSAYTPEAKEAAKARLAQQIEDIKSDYMDQLIASGGTPPGEVGPLPSVPPGSERTGLPGIGKPGLRIPEPVSQSATPATKGPVVDTVRIRLKNGKSGTVPRSSLAAALALGAVEVR